MALRGKKKVKPVPDVTRRLASPLMCHLPGKHTIFISDKRIWGCRSLKQFKGRLLTTQK